MMKWLKQLPLLMILVMTLAACGSGNDDSAGDIGEQATQPVNGAGEGTENKQEETNMNQDKTEKEIVREEAAYVGQVDVNSIEVNTESQTMTLQITEVTGVDWNTIAKNAHVIIEYYQNENDQYMLTSINVVEEKKKPDTKEDATRIEAAYVGQVDGNSIQVNTEFESLTLQISEGVNVNWSKLATNQHVIVEYVKNSNGQHVLQHIEIVDEGSKEETKADTIREEAAYVGQVDPNSIQVNTEFQQLTLQIGEIKNVNWSSFETNQRVIVEYYQNKDGQYILTNIE